MEKQNRMIRIMYIAGISSFLVGTIDPLEGSVIIVVGSLFLTLSTYLSMDRHRKIFLFSLILILIGVSSMIFFSSLGGFGGNSNLSWWWSLLIIPYPVGWMISLFTLIRRLFGKPDEQAI